MSTFSSLLDWIKNPKSLWIQRRPLVYGIGLIIATLFVVFAAGWPVWQQMQTSRGQLQKQKAELAKLQKRSNIVTKIDPVDREGFRLAGQALPLAKEPLLILRTLERVAQETEVGLGKYDVNPGIISTESAEADVTNRGRVKARGGVQDLQIKLEISGNFAKIRSALETIEQTLPLMEVVELTISPQRKSQTSGASQLYVATILVKSTFAPFSVADLAKLEPKALTPDQKSTRDQIRNMKFRAENATGSAGVRPNNGNNTNLFGIEPVTQQEGQNFLNPDQSASPSPELTPQESPLPEAQP